MSERTARPRWRDLAWLEAGGAARGIAKLEKSFWLLGGFRFHSVGLYEQRAVQVVSSKGSVGTGAGECLAWGSCPTWTSF